MPLSEMVQRTARGVSAPPLDAELSALDALLRFVQQEPTGAAAAGAGAAAGSYATWRALRWLAPVGVALYARIRSLDLAKHPKRAALLAALQEHPGATTRDLVIATGLNEGTALHHLRTLQRARLVASRRVGRDRAWHVAGAPPPSPAEQDALHAPARRAILDLATARPGLTQAELARALGLARATVHHHVDALRAAGLLDVRRDGMRARCFANVPGA